MKTRNLTILSIIGFFIAFSSCRDDFDFDLASENLSFSTDTLNLDTIFNHTNSQTYKFTIHNNQNEDVQIPRIYLTRNNSSLYRLNVDGNPGYEFENVAVRKKDSIFIFVEIAAGEVLNNQVYEDEINFELTSGNQQVKLLSYLEKAKFYNTEESENYSLNETNWDSEYSRVLFGKINAEDLTISAGTKIYFHNEAELNVNGNLTAVGNLQNKIIFRTDRMDERSESLPDNWGKIKLNPNTTNTIDYTIIKGGKIGLEIESSTLTISNTKILNNQNLGLYAINSTIVGKNLLINNNDVASLAIEGGNYEFVHSTFGNYFNIGQTTGVNYSLFLSNTTGENAVNAPLQIANFYNCIFYGRSSNAVYFDKTDGIAFNYEFKNNIIRMDFPEELTGIDSSNSNEDPLFVDTSFEINDLRLLEDSPAKDLGNNSYVNLAPTDFYGISRDSSPTPGAFETLVTPEQP